MTTHVVQWSTGMGSAEVCRRAVERYGRDSVDLLTADTLVEDEDNWRFAHEVVDYLDMGHRWTVLADGRTPMQAGRDRSCVPNNRMAVCSELLKRRLLRRHIDAHYDPADTLIHLGFDWNEYPRFKRALKPWKPYTVEALLMEPPLTSKLTLIEQWRQRGIEPPRLYGYGFGHANCGGACVRAGQASWRLLLSVNRERYLSWEAEEEHSRAQLGKDVAILRETVDGEKTPLTLRRFRERIDTAEADAPALFDQNDWGACGCFMGDDEQEETANT